MKEKQKVELYLDNDATGEAYTGNFIRVAQLFCFCRQKNLSTDWDMKSLRGRKDKLGQLIANLEIEPAIEKEIWKIQKEVSDQSYHYEGYEDINAFLVGKWIHC